MPILDRLFKKTPRKRIWQAHPEELPWFDRPDAPQTLERWRAEGRVEGADADRLKDWVEKGYCVASGLVEPADIDGMMRDLEGIWTAPAPIPALDILGAQLKEGDPATLPHWRALQMPEAERFALRDRAPWRVHNFFAHSAPARRIHQHEGIRRICSLIFGLEAQPQYTINFMFGSRQHLHQDTVVFAIFPINYLIGVWLACEDISADSGPLVYYPGSHREPLYEAFDNYPQTSLKTCLPETKAAYEANLDRLAEKYEKKQFLAKKGDILFWHGMLIHGGDGIKNPALTRKSYVCHYIPDGKNVEREIVGPFNW